MHKGVLWSSILVSYKPANGISQNKMFSCCLHFSFQALQEDLSNSSIYPTVSDFRGWHTSLLCTGMVDATCPSWRDVNGVCPV